MLILNEAIKAAYENYGNEKIHIEAQTYAKEFYAKAGFEQRSESFVMDGIEHIKMILETPCQAKE